MARGETVSDTMTGVRCGQAEVILHLRKRLEPSLAYLDGIDEMLNRHCEGDHTPHTTGFVIKGSVGTHRGLVSLRERERERGGGSEASY